ncbi:TIGR00269 family protein [archaeon]|nr:TIGR00269 family protein [archaeon]
MNCFECGKESWQRMFRQGDKLAIAFSGGKDSTALLYLMHKHFSKSNELHAIMVDEGYKGYRDESIKIGLKHLKKLKIPFTIKYFKNEFGFQMQDKLIDLKKKKLGQSCSVCGTLRRALLNETARGLKADRLLTGHNLDDECQSIVMNFFQNDFNRMLKLRPVESAFLSEGFVKRAKPFYSIPETELQAYCLLNKLKHYSSDCCPASHSVKRRFYKNKLNEFEARFPGTKQSTLNFFEGLLPLIKEKGIKGRQSCIECGQPSTGRQCRKCMFLKKLAD